MAINETYKEKILTDILLDFLLSGQVPTADQLEAELQDFLDEHPDLTKPVVADYENTVDRFENSSASKYNQTFQTLKEDMGVLVHEIISQMQDSMVSFDRWKIEIDFLSKKLRDLNTRIEGLLLLEQETAGFFDFIEDNFVDFSKINLIETDAEIDIYNHVVSLARGVTLSATRLDKINLNGLKNTDILFTVLTRDFLVSVTPAPGSELKNAFMDEQKIFQNRLLMKSPRLPVSVELKAKLGNSPILVSKIIADLHAANNNSTITITAQYSNDNYNWFNIPSNNHTQAVDRSAYFIFPETEMQYIKFIMTKNGPDDVDGNRYVYEFGIKLISLFNHSFNLEGGNILQSNILEILDEDGNIRNFNRIALEACEAISEDTNIEYFISAYNTENEEFTDYIQLDPINRENPSFATIMDLGGLGIIDNEDGITGELDTITSGINSRNLNINRLDGSGNLGYNFINSADVPINFYISSDNVLNLLEDSIQIKRNIGDKDSITLVRGVKAGWNFVDPYYSTIFEVSNPEGTTIDLGIATAELDGSLVSGKVSITAGRHFFKTHKNNWALVTTGLTIENDLRAADPLYPFNHRLAIEGYTYDSSFIGNQLYTGMDMFYEIFMSKISIFDFVNNLISTDYSRFAVDLLDDGRMIILVKYNNTISDNINEELDLSYRLKNNTFNKLKFKAILKTTNSQKSPLLTAYRLKIAN
jgi:hypothetical protein